MPYPGSLFVQRGRSKTTIRSLLVCAMPGIKSIKNLFGKSKRSNNNEFPLVSPNDQDQPLTGVQFSFILEEFIRCGGTRALTGLTTTQVVKRFVQPMTKHQKESYCDMLKRQGRGVYVRDTASAFISHAHKCCFFYFIEALTNHFGT